RKGKNTIEFTVIRGEEELEGEFVVTYAEQLITGAQYKTTLPNSGRLKLFGGELEIELPKVTMLRKPSPDPTLPVPTIELFDSQELLFGIADKQDGRTIKRYNRVGEVVSGDIMDGILGDIPT